jgi:hypothetical protein
MRKRLFVLTIVTLITLVVATPALAGRGGPSGNRNEGSDHRQPFDVAGTMDDIGENAITAQVMDGNRPCPGISPHLAARHSSTPYACAQDRLLRSPGLRHGQRGHVSREDHPSCARCVDQPDTQEKQPAKTPNHSHCERCMRP